MKVGIQMCALREEHTCMSQTMHTHADNAPSMISEQSVLDSPCKQEDRNVASTTGCKGEQSAGQCRMGAGKYDRE